MISEGGRRNHHVRFKKHVGTVDELGQPTLPNEYDWQIVIPSWFASLRSASGGEPIRGRQVTAQTTHVLIGEYYGAKDATADMLALVDGIEYEVLAVYDPDGLNQEIRVELRRTV